MGSARRWPGRVRNGATVTARPRRRATPACWPAGPAAFTLPDRGLARRRAHAAAGRRRAAGRPAGAAPAHLALVDTIVAGGAEPTVEHGVVTGEVRGLEVCRVVDDPHTGAVRLEVGVGAHDREAFTIMHGDVPTVEALAGVVRAVDEHRRTGAAQHPLSRLVPERLLRWQLIQDPALLGLAAVERVEPPLPRPNVKDRVPCVAVGRSRRRPAGAARLLGRRRPRPRPVRDRRPAQHAGRRWWGGLAGRAGARPRAGDGRAGRLGRSGALAGAVLRLSLGRLVGRRRRRPRWPPGRWSRSRSCGPRAGRPAATVTVRRPSTWFAATCSASRAAPRRRLRSQRAVLAGDLDGQRAAGDATRDVLGGGAGEVDGEDEVAVLPAGVDDRACAWRS